MTETPPIERPPAARATVSRPRSRKPPTVSASALAQHLDCSRTYIGKLEAEGVIQRRGDGFLLDESRVAYLRHLRRERQQSPRTEADADHVKLKTEMLQLRLMQARRELVNRDAHEAMIDQMAGLILTKLGGWPARIAVGTLACDGEPKPCCASCAPTLPRPVPNWQTNRMSRRSINQREPVRPCCKFSTNGWKAAMPYHFAVA